MHVIFDEGTAFLIHHSCVLNQTLLPCFLSYDFIRLSKGTSEHPSSQTSPEKQQQQQQQQQQAQFVEAVNYSLSVKDLPHDRPDPGRLDSLHASPSQGQGQGQGSLHLIELKESHRMASQKTSPDGSSNRGVSTSVVSSNDTNDYRNAPIIALTLNVDGEENGEDEPLLSPFQGTTTTASASANLSSASAATTTAAIAVSETVPASTSSSSPWISAVDPASGKTYYFNSVTGKKKYKNHIIYLHHSRFSRVEVYIPILSFQLHPIRWMVLVLYPVLPVLFYLYSS